MIIHGLFPFSLHRSPLPLVMLSVSVCLSHILYSCLAIFVGHGLVCKLVCIGSVTHVIRSVLCGQFGLSAWGPLGSAHGLLSNRICSQSVFSANYSVTVHVCLLFIPYNICLSQCIWSGGGCCVNFSRRTSHKALGFRKLWPANRAWSPNSSSILWSRKCELNLVNIYKRRVTGASNNHYKTVSNCTQSLKPAPPCQ